MSKKEIKELFERLPFKDRLFIRLSKYMPSMIRRRILMRYVPLLVSEALKFALRKVENEMGIKAFRRALDQLPISVKDKDGVWTLPAGTTKEEVYQFLIQLREREADKAGEEAEVMVE